MPDPTGPHPAEALGDALRVQALRSVMLHSAIAARLGITVTDFNCLNLLSLDGPQTPGELAGRLGITRGGAATAMIDRLEAAGYVRRRRDERDRRRVNVELVAEVAQTAIAPLFGDFGEAVNGFLAEYSEQELKMLLEFVANLSELTRQATSELRATGSPRAESTG